MFLNRKHTIIYESSSDKTVRKLLLYTSLYAYISYMLCPNYYFTINIIIVKKVQFYETYLGSIILLKWRPGDCDRPANWCWEGTQWRWRIWTQIKVTTFHRKNQWHWTSFSYRDSVLRVIFVRKKMCNRPINFTRLIGPVIEFKDSYFIAIIHIGWTYRIMRFLGDNRGICC
jgi:hypothetical protein